MINQIRIKNYQSHKDTTINLQQGLNVITGASDSGKSSILRAFNWVFTNRPLGDEIKNWDSKPDDPICVEIDINNKTVGKQRLKKKTSYYIIENGKKKSFDVVDKDVPIEIIHTLGISEINVQAQHDKYFLIDSNTSAGKVAEKFNELVGLDIIDKTFKNFNSNILETKRTIEQSENSIKSFEKDIEALSFVSIYQEKFSTLLKQFEQKEKLLQQRETIQKIFNTGQDIIKQQNKLKVIVKFQDKIESLVQQQKEINTRQKQFETINSLFSNAIEIEEKEKKLECLPKYSSQIETFIEQIKEKIITEDKKSFVEDKIHSLKNIIQRMDVLESTIKEQTEGLKNFLIKEKVCPVCGTLLTKDKIESMLR